MRQLVLAALAVCVGLPSASAEFINLPVKWSQTPWDEYGASYLSNHLRGYVIADDFVCADDDPIVAMRWWGTYGIPEAPREGRHPTFDISFHLSVGAHPASVPLDGEPIALYQVQAQEVHVGYVYTTLPLYRYDAYLPEEFDQYYWSHQAAAEQGANVGELFVDICQPNADEDWYWHSVVPAAEWPWGPDWGAVSEGGHDGPWESGFGDWPLDVAFEVMAPEPATAALLCLGGLALLRRRR